MTVCGNHCFSQTCSPGGLGCGLPFLLCPPCAQHRAGMRPGLTNCFPVSASPGCQQPWGLLWGGGVLGSVSLREPAGSCPWAVTSFCGPRTHQTPLWRQDQEEGDLIRATGCTAVRCWGVLNSCPLRHKVASWDPPSRTLPGADSKA